MIFEEEQVNGDAPANDKILLVDADTIVYATCSVHEEEAMHPNWPAENYDEPVYEINLKDAEAAVIDKLAYMKRKTGCQKVVLYFTGKENFRYELFPAYKSNRKKVRHPAGRQELAALLCEKYNNTVMCTGWEADDEVVYLKHNFPDTYILAAIDKDVLNATPGKHYNYNKDIFIETQEEQSKFWPFLQCITGDPGDGLKGVPGIGAKKALNFIEEGLTDELLWKGVVEAYESKGLTEKDALLTMHMVNMHQFNGSEIVLWQPQFKII